VQLAVPTKRKGRLAALAVMSLFFLWGAVSAATLDDYNTRLSRVIASLEGHQGERSRSGAQPSAPANLDFGTQAARDYTNLSPDLKQVFFIGDCVTSSGLAQTVVVPAGATRLFLGPMDGFHWYDNVGAFTVIVTSVPRLDIRPADLWHAGISWPTNAPDYLLEYSTNMPASEWIPITNSSIVVGDKFLVTVDVAFRQQFFRLRRP